MPNWTYCTLKAPKKVLEKYRNENDELDFNLIIPQPKEYSDLELTAGGDEDFAIYWYLTKKNTYPLYSLYPRPILNRYFSGFLLSLEPSAFHDYISKYFPETEEESQALYERGAKYVYLADTYGARDWYDWCHIYWGTKWNACYCVWKHDGVKFDTAWVPPVPVIKKIFADNPDCTIGFYWTNEDWDGYHHIIRHKSGKLNKLNCEGVFDGHFY